MRLRVKGEERKLGPLLVKAMVVLDDVLQTSTKLEDRGLAKIRWVEENWIEVEGGGWVQVNGTFEERGGEPLIASRENIRDGRRPEGRERTRQQRIARTWGKGGG